MSPVPRRLLSLTLTSASQPSVGIAAGDPEIAGLLLLDRDIENDAIRRRARLGAEFHRFEVAELLQVALTALDQRAIVGIALADIELTADHLVARLGVAMDLDALDIETFALVDDVDEIDHLAISARLGARQILAKGSPLLASSSPDHRRFCPRRRHRRVRRLACADTAQRGASDGFQVRSIATLPKRY